VNSTVALRLEKRFAEAMVVAVGLEVLVLEVDPVSIGELFRDIWRTRNRENLLVGLAHHVLEVDDGVKTCCEHSGTVEDKEKESEAALRSRNTKVLPNEKVWFDRILNLQPLLFHLFLFHVVWDTAKENSVESFLEFTESECSLCPVDSFEGPENNKGGNNLTFALIRDFGQELLPRLLNAFKTKLFLDQQLSFYLFNFFGRVFLFVHLGHAPDALHFY